MFRRFVAVPMISLTLLAPAAHAAPEDEILGTFGADLGRLSVNLPVWLSQHLPSVMAPVGLGAGSGIGDDSGGFSFGLMTRIGAFNRLPDIAYGLEMIDVGDALPSLLPWPQLGAVFGVNLGDGFELGADIQFIPTMDIAAPGVNLKASLIAASVTARWRINKADGLLPAFVIGIGGSYYSGDFSVGAGYENAYEETLDDGTRVTGTARIDAAPGVNWSIFQAVPELRLAWDIGGIFRPFVGFGAGVSFGSVGNSLKLKGSVTIDTINGNPVNQAPETYESTAFSFSTSPARYSLRPHLGFDVVLGMFALTVQADLVLSGKDRINADLDDAVETWMSNDPNYLFNANTRGSQTHNALVFTAVARLQF
jgi:hypothetical protein